jgi:serine phosphatase RsbU (regulator of sigma subunit)
MTRDEIAAFFARRLQAFAQRDAETLSACYVDDCTIESPTAGTVCGRSAADAVIRHWFTAFPDVTMSAQELLIVGNRIVECVIVSGTDTGGFLGEAPTGKPFQFPCVILFTLRDGRIAQERRVWDLYGLMAQLSGTQSPAAAENARVYRATLERARMERELKVAADIQRALLPDLHRSTANFQVAAASVPCRAIGGDFFDSYDYANGAFAFCLGDVAGKGPPAALLAAELQGILAAQSQHGETPAQVVSALNRLLMRRAVAARFTTLVYGVLTSDGTFRYCNAGHNPPLIIHANGIEQLAVGGPVVGAFEDARYDEATLRLHHNDMLVVYSDGITEALDPQGMEYGEERLVSCATANNGLPPQSLLERILADVRQFSENDARSDDQTALVLRYSRAPEEI